jgi:hypothetical protein
MPILLSIVLQTVNNFRGKNMSRKTYFWNIVRIAVCLLFLVQANGKASAFAIELHPEITMDALPFIRPFVMIDINDENDFEDIGNANDPDHHFDDCHFAGATAKINANLATALIDADPKAFDSDDLADKWGQMMHTTEDFYSHSNWVNSGKTTLIDSGLGFRTPLTAYSMHDGAMIVEGENEHPLGPDSSLSLDPNNKTVKVFTGSNPPSGVLANTQIPGIITGYWPANSSDNCPDNAALSHGDLNKDKASIPLHDQARALATQQVRHEWCRLLNISNDQYGFNGPATLLGLWVLPNGNPHPQNTPCAAPETPGPVEITATVKNIHVINDTDPNASGELNFVSLIFTGNFSQSARSDAANSSSIGDDTDVKPEDLPGAVRLCVHTTDKVAISLQGWDDDGALALDGEFENPLGLVEGDEPLDGATLTLIGPNFNPGTHIVASDDLDVTYTVSMNTTDGDSDGLGDCAEKVFGTLPNDPDTDDDGLTDGAEVNTYGTKPTVADSDNDGLIDGTEINGSNPTKPLIADSDNDALIDGTEDANHNGALDLNETNPNNPDSDQDVLTDGCEVFGTNPTKPLDADSDDDSLLDGVEDANQNCTLDSNETNPNDADSDDDGLNDGFEVTNGTDPLDADSDDDGIPDGADVEWIQGSVNALPDSAFKGEGNRAAILSQLDAIETMVSLDKRTQAVKELEILRTRLDGCGASADGNDWIVDCTEQVNIRTYIDLLISNLIP